MHRTPLPACILLGAIGAVCTFPAVAAAPVYFDIGGLLLYALGAIFGLLIFPSCTALSKSRGNKRIFASLSIACIVALAVPFVTEYVRERQAEGGLLADADAFAKYCADGLQPVVHPELVVPAAVLHVRHESVANEPKWIGGAGGLVRRIRQDQAFCSRSGIVTIAPVSPVAGEEPLYPVCATGASGKPAEYEMLVRDSYDSKKGTGRLPWGVTVMYKSSIVLTRKVDKQMVAQGDFYFVGPRVVQVESRCPKTDEAILQFLVTAIPKG